MRKMLGAVLSADFVRECDTNMDLINPVVSTFPLSDELKANL